MTKLQLQTIMSANILFSNEQIRKYTQIFHLFTNAAKKSTCTACSGDARQLSLRDRQTSFMLNQKSIFLLMVRLLVKRINFTSPLLILNCPLGPS